ncbi:MAG: esterase/lipase superfamily enzyme [Saprospiraceae bacterium]
MKEEYVKWYSPNLSGEIEMLIFGHTGYPVVLFPTSMGSYKENRDFNLIESAKWYIEQGLIRIYCPDSVDKMSWYNKGIHPKHKVQNHIWYDKMINHEVVEKIKDHTSVGKVVMAGCSFGAYHAANFAFRHPGYVSHLFCMSGAYDIRSFLNGHYDNDVYFNNPMDYLQDANDHEIWNMDIVLGTSDGDICLKDNVALSRLLKGKGINHWLDVRKNATHDWAVWRDMFPHYLSKINFG